MQLFTFIGLDTTMRCDCNTAALQPAVIENEILIFTNAGHLVLSATHRASDRVHPTGDPNIYIRMCRRVQLGSLTLHLSS